MRIKDPIHVRNNLAAKAGFLASQGDFGQAADVVSGMDRWGLSGIIEWIVEAETGSGKDLASGPDHPWGAVDSIPWRARPSLAEIVAAVGRNTSSRELLELAKAILQVGGSDRVVLPRESVPRAVARGFLAEAEGDREAAEPVYEELSEYSGTASIWSFIPFDRLLGLLASLLGRHDDALRHFEVALELCRRAEFRPQLAWTCSDYAGMLLDRDDPGDREKAIELQDEALAITQELGMRPLTERILARREILRA